MLVGRKLTDSVAVTETRRTILTARCRRLLRLAFGNKTFCDQEHRPHHLIALKLGVIGWMSYQPYVPTPRLLPVCHWQSWKRNENTFQFLQGKKIDQTDCMIVDVGSLVKFRLPAPNLVKELNDIENMHHKMDHKLCMSRETNKSARRGKEWILICER